MNRIEVWHPRYHDNVVLLAKYKIGPHNLIVFTQADSLKDREFYISGEAVRECPLESNGKISCYAVPMDALIALDEAY